MHVEYQLIGSSKHTKRGINPSRMLLMSFLLLLLMLLLLHCPVGLGRGDGAIWLFRLLAL